MFKTVQIILLLTSLLIIPINLYALDAIRISASDGEAGDYFGGAVDISGDYAVITATGDDDGAENSGAVYVFHFDGENWIEEAKLTAGNPEDEVAFGGSVSIDGDVVVVGDSGRDQGEFNGVGMVHIFERTDEEWEETHRLRPGNVENRISFGSSLAVTGNKLIVGSSGDREDGSGGRIYTYVKIGNNWSLQDILTSDNDVSGASLGRAIDYDRQRLLVGAPFFGDNSEGAVLAFTYTENEWYEVRTLAPEQLSDHAWFGSAVSINGGYAAIGSPNYGDNENYSGAVFIYENVEEVWEFRQVIEPHVQIWELGKSVSLLPNLLFIGSSNELFVYRKTEDNWREVDVLSPDVRESYGSSIATDSRWAIVGAPGAQVDSVESGAAYIYDISELLGVDDDYGDSELPSEFILYPAYPNPFNSTVALGFNLPSQQQVSLQLFNQRGRLIETLVDGRLGVGIHSSVWESDNQSSGVYFYRLESGQLQQTRRLTLVK